jgi:ABC-type dipeptide/oligopeptide/nickel transport system permease subunit
MKANCRLALHPGAARPIVVLSFNLAGDGFHDALNPRLSGSY